MFVIVHIKNWFVDVFASCFCVSFQIDNFS